MRHSPGDPRPIRHIHWTRLKVRMRRLVEGRRARRAQGDADACASGFTERLEEAVLYLQTGRAGFEGAARKPHHIGELRRVLGVLLDILADWEMRAGRGS